MQTLETQDSQKHSLIHSLEEWLKLDFRTDENNVVLGTPEQPIIRVGTKNVIEAPEKSFKTTFLLRLALGLACGQTAYEQFPVPKKRRGLYLHGELSPHEIQERTIAACVGMSRPPDSFWQGRDISMHFKEQGGRNAIREAIRKFKPQDVFFDPWQAFITGLDENNFKDVSEATKFIDGLIHEFGITVHLATHMGKDRGRGTRGHSSIAGWRDSLIKLERYKEEMLKVTVDPRWAKKPDPFHLRFDRGTLWPVDHFSGKTEEIRHSLLISGRTMSKEALRIAIASPTPEAFRKALERAQKAGAIHCNDDSVHLRDEAQRTTP